METKLITVETIINADKKKVWEYWTEPQYITQWNFATEDWACPTAENDLRVGGKYKARMEAKDGSFGFDFEATYNEIEYPNKIVYTIADGRKVMTLFQDLDGTTKVTTVFEAEQSNPAEMQQQGWQSILDNFKNFVESN